jgi:hypothetical protein
MVTEQLTILLAPPGEGTTLLNSGDPGNAGAISAATLVLRW